MMRWKWVLVVVAAAIGSFALARYGIPWARYLVLGDGPPPGFVDPNKSYVVPDEGPVRYEQGLAILPPDQPGWRARVGNDYYKRPWTEFVAAARRTETLGRPGGTGNVRHLAPFVLAALPWMDSSVPEEHPTRVLSKVAQMLRQQKIIAFGNPMALSYPTARFKGDFWKDPLRTIWLGIPVPRGTKVEKPLVLREFPGAEVVIATDDFTTIGPEEDWGRLRDQAKALGRETTMPMVHRFQGWRAQPPKVRVQRMLPLAPAP